MKEITGPEDQMRGVAAFELPDGRRVKVAAHAVREFGAEQCLKWSGVDDVWGDTPETLPVFRDGLMVGTLPRAFDPVRARSRSEMYDLRPGDFRRTERGWEACSSLGDGDLDAVEGFRPA